MSDSNDIKVGDWLECVSTNSTDYTEGAKYPVVKANKGSESIEVSSDKDCTWAIGACGDDSFYGRNEYTRTFAKFKKVNTMENFKVGESVYRFSMFYGVTIEVIDDADYDSEDYLLQCHDVTYTKKGFMHKYANIPSLYKLNQESYDKLCAFVGADEVPELPLLGSDLTIGILKNQSLQACFCSDDSDEDARSEACLALIVRYQDGSFFDINGASWFKAVSVDNNRNEITELPRSDV